MEGDLPAAERLYRDLRDDAEAASGGVAHERRIFRLACRRRGTDCTIEVGNQSAAIDGRIVVAILQFGRAAYTIHCRDAEDPGSVATVEISRKTVYAVTDFD